MFVTHFLYVIQFGNFYVFGGTRRRTFLSLKILKFNGFYFKNNILYSESNHEIIYRNKIEKARHFLANNDLIYRNWCKNSNVKSTTYGQKYMVYRTN